MTQESMEIVLAESPKPANPRYGPVIPMTSRSGISVAGFTWIFSGSDSRHTSRKSHEKHPHSLVPSMWKIPTYTMVSFSYDGGRVTIRVTKRGVTKTYVRVDHLPLGDPPGRPWEAAGPQSGTSWNYCKSKL